MNNRNNAKLTSNAQKLRKNMTKEERHLWYDFLKLQPETFNRQKVIGKYIADFYCAEKKLVIELDGSQHYYDKGQRTDKERDAVGIDRVTVFQPSGKSGVFRGV